MTCTVAFVTAGAAGAGANGVFKVRAQERITIPGTTVNTIGTGEFAVVCNGETGPVAVAFGTAPVPATAADASPVTSAGYPVAAGTVSPPICPAESGAKIAIAAIP